MDYQINSIIKNFIKAMVFILAFDLNAEGTNKLNTSDKKAFLGVVPGQSENGVEVQYIIPNSSASRSDLKIGDIIVKVNDTKISQPIELVNLIKNYDINQSIRIKYSRNGLQNETLINLGERLFIQSLINYPAPKIKLRTLSEDKVYNLEKDKVTILYFWATWCKFCQMLESEVNQLALSNKSQIQFIGIMNEDTEVIKKYFNGSKPIYPILTDINHMTTIDYGISGFPTIVVIDQKGFIRYGNSATNGGLKEAFELGIKLSNNILSK